MTFVAAPAETDSQRIARLERLVTRLRRKAVRANARADMNLRLFTITAGRLASVSQFVYRFVDDVGAIIDERSDLPDRHRYRGSATADTIMREVTNAEQNRLVRQRLPRNASE